MIDWSLTIPPEARAAEQRARLSDAIKTARDAAISAGLTVQGIAVATDELSQNRLAAAALSALIDPAVKVQWKLPGGAFVSLDAAQILHLAAAVRAHVQACFDHEAALLADFAQGKAPDLATGWP